MKCTHREKIHLTDLPDGIFAQRLLSAAYRYFSAGKSLLMDLALYEPGYFSSAHSVELALKSFLAAKGYKRNDLRTHCLECLYQWAIRGDLEAQKVQSAPAMIHHLNGYVEMYRYPDFVMVQRISPPDVIAFGEAMLGAVDGVVLRSYLDSLGPGRIYEVDEFRHVPERPA